MGPGAVGKLVSSFSEQPMLLLSGDQLTGKSTVSKALAEHLGGKALSTGRLVRAEAERLELSVEEMTQRLADHPTANIELDYKAAQVIAEGDSTVFESRLAGHLGTYLRELGRENLLTVYLSAGPRERALRYLNREIGATARQQLEADLNVPADADLSQCLAALSEAGGEDVKAGLQSFSKIAGRDEIIRGELIDLYGVDYREHDRFDLVIDTTKYTADEVVALIKSAMEERA